MMDYTVFTLRAGHTCLAKLSYINLSLLLPRRDFCLFQRTIIITLSLLSTLACRCCGVINIRNDTVLIAELKKLISQRKPLTTTA